MSIATPSTRLCHSGRRCRGIGYFPFHPCIANSIAIRVHKRQPAKAGVFTISSLPQRPAPEGHQANGDRLVSMSRVDLKSELPAFDPAQYRSAVEGYRKTASNWSGSFEIAGDAKKLRKGD